MTHPKYFLLLLTLLITSGLFIGADTGRGYQWSWRNPLPTGNRLMGVAANSEIYVVVTSAGTILTSPDGFHWDENVADLGIPLNEVIWDGAYFLALGEGVILESEDGENWVSTLEGVSGVGTLNGIAASPLGHVAMGDNTVLFREPGGLWQPRVFFNDPFFEDVDWDGTWFWAVGHTKDQAQNEARKGIAYRSKDGRNWEEVGPKLRKLMYGCASNGDIFVMVGQDGRIHVMDQYYGQDRWTEVNLSHLPEIKTVVWSGTRFLAGTEDRVFESVDGHSWTSTLNPSETVNAISTGPCDTLAVGDNGMVSSLANNGVWASRTHGLFQDINGVAHNGSRWVAVGDGPYVLFSEDGVNWGKTRYEGLHGASDVVWSEAGYFLASTREGNLYTSEDGFSWRWRHSADGQFSSVASNATRNVAVGVNGLIRHSKDGVNWKTASADFFDYLKVIFADTNFYAVGEQGQIRASISGEFWALQTSGVSAPLHDIAYGQAGLVAVGLRTILHSQMGNTWTQATSPLEEDLQSVAWNGEEFIIFTATNQILRSDDGLSWTAETTPFRTIINEALSFEDRMVTVGPNGRILVGDCETWPASPKPEHQRAQGGLTFPWVSNSSRFESRLAICNYGTEPADVILRARRGGYDPQVHDEDDYLETAGPFTITAHGFLDREASELFPGLGNGSGYSVEVETTSQTIGGNWITNNLDTPSGGSPSLGVAVVQPLDALPTTDRSGQELLMGYMPADDGALSGSVLLNIGDRSSRVELTMKDQNGQIVGEKIVTLEPGFPSAELTSGLVGEQTGAFSLTASSVDEPLTGVGFVFNQLGEAAIGNASGMARSCGTSSFLFPWVSNSDAFESILVINNLGDQDAVVTLNARRSGGQNETYETVVPAGGFFKGFASEIFQDLGSGTGYAVLASSEAPGIYGRWVTNNLLTPSGQSPSQVVGVDLNDPQSTRSGKSLLFGIMPVNNGLSAAPVLVNLGISQTDVDLYFYNQAGDLVHHEILKKLVRYEPAAILANNILPEGAGDLYLVAVASRGPITGAGFVFNQESEPAIGNVTAIQFEE